MSTCQVEFIFREPLSLFYYRGVDLLLFNYMYICTTRGRYRNLAGTTTLAYRIVINCTTAESALELVSTFRLACSSHRQASLLLEMNVTTKTAFSYYYMYYVKLSLLKLCFLSISFCLSV